jgi:hypothetical protein
VQKIYTVHKKQEIPKVAGPVVLSSRGWVAAGLPEHNHNHERDSSMRFSTAGLRGLIFPEIRMPRSRYIIFNLTLIFQCCNGHFLYID